MVIYTCVYAYTYIYIYIFFFFGRRARRGQARLMAAHSRLTSSPPTVQLQCESPMHAAANTYIFLCVRVCVCVCMHTCMHARMYVCMYATVCIYIHIHKFIFYLCIYIIDTYTYIYIYIYIYICVCVCACVYVHTHTNTNEQPDWQKADCPASLPAHRLQSLLGRPLVLHSAHREQTRPPWRRVVSPRKHVKDAEVRASSGGSCAMAPCTESARECRSAVLLAHG